MLSTTDNNSYTRGTFRQVPMRRIVFCGMCLFRSSRYIYFFIILALMFHGKFHCIKTINVRKKIAQMRPLTAEIKNNN